MNDTFTTGIGPRAGLCEYWHLNGLLLYVVAGLCLCGCQLDVEPMDYRRLPEFPSAEVSLYIEKCGDCHAAPMPTTHIGKEWPGVLNRMDFRMTSQKMMALTPADSAVILRYLQRNAK